MSSFRLNEACRDLGWIGGTRCPALHIGRGTIRGAIIKRAVTYQLCIDTAVGSMVDVFIEDAVKHGTHIGAPLQSVDVDSHLRLCCSHKCCKPGYEDFGSVSHIMIMNIDIVHFPFRGKKRRIWKRP